MKEEKQRWYYTFVDGIERDNFAHIGCESRHAELAEWFYTVEPR